MTNGLTPAVAGHPSSVELAHPSSVERAGGPSLPEFAPSCPLCHTVDAAVTAESVQAGAGWTCTTCGQAWSARRLQAVAAYARYVAVH